MTELHDAELYGSAEIGPDFSVLNGREALQQLVDLHDTTQFAVNDDDDDDPVLLTLPERNVVDTWRQDYPYDERMPRADFQSTTLFWFHPVQAPRQMRESQLRL